MTPAPQAKRLDARILSKADLDRLSSVAWNYARESAVVRVGDYLQDVASLRGHLDALEAAAAAREEQYKTFIAAVKLHLMYSGGDHADAVRAALAALTNGAG